MGNRTARTWWAAAPLVLLLCVLAAASQSDLAKEQRIRICGSDSDCLRVRASSRAEMIVDGLDLDRDTPQDVLNRLPSWFGPAERPLALGLSLNNVFDMHVPLRQQRLAIGDVVDLIVWHPSEPAGTEDL